MPREVWAFTPKPSRPRKGKLRARAAEVCFPCLAINPVVFTARVALPAPLSGISNDDGFTEQDGEEAEAGITEQLMLTVSVNPFRGAIAIPAIPWPPIGIVPNDCGVSVIVKSGCGGGPL